MLQFAVLLVSLNDENRFFIESLYRRYRDYMYKTASAILQNPHDAEDAVMDVMCKIIKYITKFDGASDTQIQNQIVIGIRIATQRRAIDYYNARKKRNKYELYPDDSDEETVHEIEDVAGDPNEIILNREMQSTVQKALLLLPQAQKDAINLVYYSGYTIAEAADFMNITAGALRGRIHKAKIKLKQILGSELYDKQ